MYGLNSLRRQNTELALRNLQDKYVGREVQANDSNGNRVTGTVSHVNLNGDRFEYFLAGRIGPHQNVELSNEVA